MEENANTLQFGAEFEAVSCLSNAEVAVVLEKQKETYEMKDINVTPAFAKTMAYAKRYGGSGDAKKLMMATTQLREDLTQFEAFHDGEVVKLEQFEMAQLANLMQADSEVEEAIALIPSLSTRFNEEDIENILAIVQKQAQSQFSSFN
ncbi:unnamed protein product [Discosporangium mesarthrocarpum]